MGVAIMLHQFDLAFYSSVKLKLEVLELVSERQQSIQFQPIVCLYIYIYLCVCGIPCALNLIAPLIHKYILT